MPREPLNQSAAAVSGSFAPAYRFENFEIRKGFLRFSNLNLEQNPSLTTLAIESELPWRPEGSLWRRRSSTNFKHFSNKNGRFSVKTYHFCVIARRARFFAPDAAIFNGTKRHPGTKFGETARSGMRPTCTPSPCTSCLVFPYKTAGRSKQIRLLLPFCSKKTTGSAGGSKKL